MSIELGKKYRHMGTGKHVKVISKVGPCYGVVDVNDLTEKHWPAFSSELEPIEDEPPTVIQGEKPNGHQTIVGSIVESWVNILIGFTINFSANMLILPMFGFHDLTLSKNFEIGMLYTVISLVRSFVIRRYFNNMKWGNK